jgi:hypothetical protein
MAETYWKRVLPKVKIILWLLILAAGLIRSKTVQASSGNIDIQLKDLGTPMNEVGFFLFKTAVLDETTGQWKLLANLEGKGTDLEGLTYASQWDAAASRLAYLVRESQMQGITGSTDSSGRLVFSGLEDGLYLVVQQNGQEYGDVSPFLVAVPSQTDNDGTDSVTVFPKASYTPQEEKRSITVTKKAFYLDLELMELVELIPTDYRYYVGIFLDSLGTIPYGDDYVREIHMQGNSVGTAVFEDLPARTYYIFETDEYGNAVSLEKAQETNGISWVCELDGNKTQEVELASDETRSAGSVGFMNIYYDLPSGFMYRAYIDITKEVLRGEEPVTTEDVFYAGIFYDEAGTDLLLVAELEQNGTVEVEVPLGGEKGDEPVTYYVYETDEEGNPVNRESFGYTVSGEQKVELRKGNPGEEMTITNVLRTVTDSPGPEEATPEPTGSAGNTESTQTPAPADTTQPMTGDDTPVECLWVMLLLSAAVVAGIRKGRS